MSANSQTKNYSISPQVAAQEVLNRRAARANLLAFTKYTKPDFEAGEHHKKIAEALERVEKGEIDRLIIEAPPRHTKSELASRRFPSWVLGRGPKKQIITSTYSGEFALDFGREVRNIVSSQDYKNIFPDVTLAEDSKAANRWHTNKQGVYVAVGVGGPITGRGAHIALIDDPFKNREEADSEVIRNKVWDWYTSTLYTRLMPGGAVILILTRWHEDDLAGRLLKEAENGGDQWEVVRLPAIANEGTDNEKALWPEWYNLASLKRIKNAIGPRDWSALYQQNPEPDEGIFFKREDFNRYPLGDEPKYLTKFGASDYAVTEGDGDFTEQGVAGLCPEGNLYIVDWISGQDESDVWVDDLLDLVKKHNPVIWGAEVGQIKKAVAPWLAKRCRQRRVYIELEPMSNTGGKVVNARSFQAMVRLGLVYIPICEWGDELIRQLTKFPAGAFDDKVDVCGIMGRLIDKVYEVSPPDKPKADNRRDYGYKSDYEEDSWKTI